MTHLHVYVRSVMKWNYPHMKKIHPYFTGHKKTNELTAYLEVIQNTSPIYQRVLNNILHIALLMYLQQHHHHDIKNKVVEDLKTAHARLGQYDASRHVLLDLMHVIDKEEEKHHELGTGTYERTEAKQTSTDDSASQ